MKYLAIPSSIFLFFFFSSFSSFLIHRRALRSQPIASAKVQRIAWANIPEHVERNLLDPEYSFVAVRRIPAPNYIHETKVRLIKNQLYSPNTTNYVREQMFAKLSRMDLRLVSRRTSVRLIPLRLSFSSDWLWFVDTVSVVVILSLTINETLKWL